MNRSSRVRLLAAFGAGVAAWESVVHASLLLSGVSPTLFGVRLTPRLNAAQTLVPALAAVALFRLAFAPTRPPIVFRLAARPLLRDELGPTLDEVLRRADRHYARLAPKVGMAVTPVGRLELRLSAYLLALYRAMREVGVPGRDAVGLLSGGLHRVMRRAWAPIDMLVPARLGSARRARIQVRLARLLAFREPDWTIGEAAAGGAYGIDVTRCVCRDFFVSEGVAQLCDEVMCAQDVLAARARGIPFSRTQTLARGDARCDFRFG